MKRVSCLFVLALVVSSAVTAQRTDLSGIKICIDPGHGGYFATTDRHVVPDPGTDFWESESNFQKALLLKTLLEAKGAVVLLTRNTNYYPNDEEPSLATRVAFANANNVNWFHSIHSNASGLQMNTNINYTLMLVREKRPGGPSSSSGNGLFVPETQEAWDISNVIGPNIKSKLRTQRFVQYLDWTFYGGVNGGFSLGVLRGLMMPGELSEGSFHDYYPEVRRLMNNSYRKLEAYALRDAFLQYFGVPPDTLGIVAGILSERGTGKLINGSRVQLLPENIVYTGDRYNNGFYMIDSIRPGPHMLRFETPGYRSDSVQVNIGVGNTAFIDRDLTTETPTAVEPGAGGVPYTFDLQQNYPNPFNPTTNIQYGISNVEPVTLKVFDMLGREVATLVNEARQPGVYHVRWDASALPSGVYLYQLRAGSSVLTKKMTLVR